MRKGAIVLTIPFRTEQSYDINQLYSGSFKKQNVEWLHFFFYTAMFWRCISQRLCLHIFLFQLVEANVFYIQELPVPNQDASVAWHYPLAKWGHLTCSDYDIVSSSWDKILDEN